MESFCLCCAVSHAWRSTWNVACGRSVTKELHFSRYFILSNLILSSCVWLAATVQDNAGRSHLLEKPVSAQILPPEVSSEARGVRRTFQSWSKAFHPQEVKAKNGRGWSAPVGGAELKGASCTPIPPSCFPEPPPSQPRDILKVLNPAAQKCSDRTKPFQPKST